jgi:hypothetical protein
MLSMKSEKKRTQIRKSSIKMGEKVENEANTSLVRCVQAT